MRDYYEVWKFIGTELDIDRNVMNTIEEDHPSDCDRIHALVEVWLNGAQLTGTRQQDLNEALQSQRVVSAMAGIGMLRNIAIWGNYQYWCRSDMAYGAPLIWAPCRHISLVIWAC